MTIECMKFKPFEKGCLQGFADIYIAKTGMEYYGIALYMKDGKRWVTFPGKEYTNKEGEKKYKPHFRMRDTAHYELLCTEIKSSIDKWCTGNNKKN